jgi:6-phosphofructokinase
MHSAVSHKFLVRRAKRRASMQTKSAVRAGFVQYLAAEICTVTPRRTQRGHVMGKYIGILTSGGDSPGLNAAIRGVAKAAIGGYGMQVIGFRDGFRGLMENRFVPLDNATLSGILTVGGTILGTSRDKPNKMPIGGQVRDMTDVIVANYRQNHLDALVCLGGGGTQKNALHLKKQGLNVLTLPKTIDNDVAGTDVSFGFDTALGIATEALDRLHSTAHSHHRIVMLEVMGHNAGWLALGAGIAGGADVILIPEIAYDVGEVAQAVKARSRSGKNFSIICVSEGALDRREAAQRDEIIARLDKSGSKPAEAEARSKPEKDKAAGKKKNGEGARDEARKQAKAALAQLEAARADHTLRLAQQLEQLTGLESRVTILGHLQRGGTPSAADRLLATRLGTACADLIEQGTFGVMVSARGENAVAVPLEEVAGQRRTVPLDHPWITSALRVGSSLGQ